MRIAMMTNTYRPHVGGVANSVHQFAEWLRRAGHEVLVACPRFDGAQDEQGVVRVPAIRHWQGTDFSLPLPATAGLHRALKRFEPDIVHSHHPFLLGDTALRVGAEFGVPAVFTHHTMYENYTHYVPFHIPRMRQLAVDLAASYADLCDAVVAPSESLRSILVARGVRTPITVVPTGVDVDRFSRGDGRRVRAEHGIPARARVVGHVGRLAPEKNLGFLTRCLILHASRDAEAHVAIVGGGPEASEIRREFSRVGLGDRLHMLGTLEGQELVDAYHAMDVFCFASTSETQGLVLLESMAAGVPVIALDSPGVRELVCDGVNGRLLSDPTEDDYVRSIERSARRDERTRMSEGARRSARARSVDCCGGRLVDLYADVIGQPRRRPSVEDSRWASVRRRLEEEWVLARHRGQLVGDAWTERGHRSGLLSAANEPS